MIATSPGTNTGSLRAPPAAARGRAADRYDQSKPRNQSPILNHSECRPLRVQLDTYFSGFPRFTHVDIHYPENRALGR